MNVGRSGPHIIKSSPRAPADLAMETGTLIPRTGIYRVIHGEHRLPHEVILFEGEQFPRCSKCRDQVVFKLVYPAEESCDPYARVIVYELPWLDEAA